MWVRRPYIDGLVTLWLGFSLGSGDGNFDRFCLWVQTEQFPAEGGHRSPLALDGLVRHAVAPDAPYSLTEEQDDAAVALLAALVAEYAQQG